MSLRNPENIKEEKEEKISAKDTVIEKAAIIFVAACLIGFFLKLIVL